MRVLSLLLLLRHSLALVAPAAKPRATRLSALTDEVLDVAQWVGTNADQLPIGEYAPFAAAGAAPRLVELCKTSRARQKQ